MEYLIRCDDKAITPDVKDDVEMTLNYVDDLEDRINQAMKYCEDIINEEIDTSDSDYDLGRDFTARDILYILSSNKIN